jgi:hypothetical protein
MPRRNEPVKRDAQGRIIWPAPRPITDADWEAFDRVLDDVEARVAAGAEVAS